MLAEENPPYTLSLRIPDQDREGVLCDGRIEENHTRWVGADYIKKTSGFLSVESTLFPAHSLALEIHHSI